MKSESGKTIAAHTQMAYNKQIKPIPSQGSEQLIVLLTLKKGDTNMKATAKLFDILGAKKLGRHNGRRIYKYKGQTYVESKGVVNEKLGTGETLSARYMIRTDVRKFFQLGKREANLLFPHIKWEFFQKYVDTRGVLPKKNFFERLKTFIIGE